MFPWIASFRSQLTPVVGPGAQAWRRPAPFDRSPTAGEIAIDPTGGAEIRNYVASRVEILKLDGSTGIQESGSPRRMKLRVARACTFDPFAFRNPIPF